MPNPTTVEAGSPETDQEALAALYRSTDGDNWPAHQVGIDTKWMSNAPMGEWLGVTTDEAGRVTGLNLENLEMEGTIPPELGNLSALKKLSLRGNYLHGTIPRNWGISPNWKNSTSTAIRFGEKFPGTGQPG